MRPRGMRRRRRLGSVTEADEEPEEEASPYTSQTLRLAIVQPGQYVAWASLSGPENTGFEHLWEVKNRFFQDDDDDSDNDSIHSEDYEDEMLLALRKQVNAEKKARILLHLQNKQNKKIWATSPYKLTCMEARGDAELIRLLLVYSETPYEEERVTPEEWEEMKENTPNQSLPVLSKCGVQWAETGAIVRVLAQNFLLMGVSNDEQLVVEATYERLRRLKLQNSLAISWVMKGEKSKDKLEWAQSQILHVILPPCMVEWETLIGKSKGPFVVASGMTVADLAIMDFLDQCSGHVVIDSLFADHIRVAALLNIVRSCPKLYHYLEERPED